MTKWTCSCLNIKIYAKKIEQKIINGTQLGTENDLADEFFSLDIAEVQLDLEGIRVEQQSLVQMWGQEWQVHRCCNCEMLTHAVQQNVQETSKILINLSLKSDPTIIESLEKSPDFSPLYRLVLGSGNDNQPLIGPLGLQSEKYESVQQTLASIHQQLNKFIESEKCAMDERLRIYERQQQEAFAELQSKVRRDKNTMISLVLAAQEGEMSNPLSDSLTDNPLSPLEESHHAVLETSTDNHDGPMHGIEDFHGLTMTKRKENKTSAPRVTRIASKGHDDDLFDLDDLNDEDDSRPFYMSDDDNDNDDTDDSSMTEDVSYSGRYSSRNVPNRSNFSSSVPISVPAAWRQYSSHTSVEEEEDDRVPAPDPEDMAASIKALARSVHGDGTEIFGDLPRRRLNTMELGKI